MSADWTSRTTFGSPAKLAMAAFVSRRMLPLIGLDGLAAFLDRARHGREIVVADRADKPGQRCPWHSLRQGRGRERPGEVDHLTEAVLRKLVEQVIEFGAVVHKISRHQYFGTRFARSSYFGLWCHSSRRQPKPRSS